MSNRGQVDLGHDHSYTFTVWKPDRELNPQYDGIPDADPWGAIIYHRNPRTGEPCHGGVMFDGPTQRQIDPDRPCWQVESLDPLTISPSVLCRFPASDGQECGDHGFIRAGRWVPA